MKKLYLYPLACLVVSGCAGRKIISDESGDGSTFYYSYGFESKPELIEIYSKKLKGKLSPNFYDYESQYYSSFLKSPETQGEAPSTKERSSFSKARSVADAMMATDLIGSTVFGGPSVFGKGFNIGMLGLSAIAPKSPEDAFVSSWKVSFKEFESRSLTLMKVDKISDTSSDNEVELIFQKRMAEIRGAAKKGGLSCDNRPEYVRAGVYRSSPIAGVECDFNGLKVKVERKSALSMPGSIVMESSGTSIVSKVLFYNLNEDARDSILASHEFLIKQGWVAIYPEKSAGVATYIVVRSDKDTKRFDPPKLISS